MVDALADIHSIMHVGIAVLLLVSAGTLLQAAVGQEQCASSWQDAGFTPKYCLPGDLTGVPHLFARRDIS
jgi:hypothetical protein